MEDLFLILQVNQIKTTTHDHPLPSMDLHGRVGHAEVPLPSMDYTEGGNQQNQVVWLVILCRRWTYAEGMAQR